MFHKDRNAEDSPFCHTRRWENASAPPHLFWVSANSQSRLLHSRRVATKPHDFTDASLLQKRKQRHLPRCCLYSSRLSCLPPASVAAPIAIPLFMMTKRSWFYDLLLPGSLQHHLFPSPHETISAVFFSAIVSLLMFWLFLHFMTFLPACSALQTAYTLSYYLWVSNILQV